MYDKAIEVLDIFYNYGYLAYIVGGYPRDNLLNIKTTDIDICTSAKPKEIMDIFDTESVSDVGYGSIKVIYKGIKFDVTTFRKDIKYENNRKPVKIKYITDLKKDLLRRDFTINTMAIDRQGNLIDLLNAKRDIEKRLIKTVGNPRYRLREDSLRILRAVRFASNLNFDIDKKAKNYIIKYGYLLKKLSGSRKKEELSKIFSSINKEKGRELLITLKLDKYLGLNNLNDIVMCDDIIGIWSQLDIIDNYPFSKLELDQINKIREFISLDVNKYTVYKYGLYISTVVGSIKKIDYKKINQIYQELPIYTVRDINIKAEDIAKCLKSEPGNYLKEIYKDLENKILSGILSNEYDELVKYIIKNY